MSAPIGKRIEELSFNINKKKSYPRDKKIPLLRIKEKTYLVSSGSKRDSSKWLFQRGLKFFLYQIRAEQLYQGGVLLPVVSIELLILDLAG